LLRGIIPAPTTSPSAVPGDASTTVATVKHTVDRAGANESANVNEKNEELVEGTTETVDAGKTNKKKSSRCLTKVKPSEEGNELFLGLMASCHSLFHSSGRVQG